jgi:type IV pilus assembly protein PilA
MIHLKEVTLKKSSTIKFEGGTIMKKKLNNKKGFSLVELLIVLAILAIIAAISISIFANVLENQRIKADKGQAAYIQSAVQTYLTESDDINLTNLSISSIEDMVGTLKNGVILMVTNMDL